VGSSSNWSFMKLFLDFLPIILFFATYKYAEGQPEWAAQFATEHFGFIVSGGVVGAAQAPVLLATLVVVAATLLQVVLLKVQGKKIDTMLWISLVLVVVLGGATVWFQSEAFIKWKPTVLYWTMAVAFWVSQVFFHKNLLQALFKGQIQLPPAIWQRLNFAWIGFFMLMGVLNLYIAYNFSTSAWVNFKLFGSLGLTFVFMLAQGWYMTRHALSDQTPASTGDKSTLPPSN
jgi:intracellular septation protein